MKTVKSPALEEVASRDLFGGLSVRWDDSHGVLTDSMGVPLSRSAAKELRALISAHLKKDAGVLASIGNGVIDAMLHPRSPRTPLDPGRFE